MTIRDARRCEIPLNEIIEGGETYNDMKSSAQSGDVKSMMDFGMWNEIQGDMHSEHSEYYYNQALYWYRRAWDKDSGCSGEQAYNELGERTKG